MWRWCFALHIKDGRLALVSTECLPREDWTSLTCSYNPAAVQIALATRPTSMTDSASSPAPRVPGLTSSGSAVFRTHALSLSGLKRAEMLTPFTLSLRLPRVLSRGQRCCHLLAFRRPFLQEEASLGWILRRRMPLHGFHRHSSPGLHQLRSDRSKLGYVLQDSGDDLVSCLKMVDC